MDAEEFDAFYEGSFGRVVAQVHALVGDRAEAQDCVQEAFVRAWSRREQLDRALSPDAWVRTTAYRLAVSRWRRLQRGRRAVDLAGAPALGIEPSPDRVAVVRALQELPETQRRALVLHHLCDLSVAAVAAETGVPEGTVKARLSRGRAALARLLGDEPTGIPGGVTHA